MIKAWKWRYATKKFDTAKKIDQSDFDRIIDAGRLAPTSYGMQLLKLVEVTDGKLREELKEFAYGQPQITDADRLIVICHQNDYSNDLVDQYIADKSAGQNTDSASLEGFKNAIKGHLSSMSEDDYANWTAKQAYIVLGAMIGEAAEMEIDSCPMEGFDKEAWSQKLAIQGYYPAVVLTLGYRDQNDDYQFLPKFRRDESELVVKI